MLCCAEWYNSLSLVLYSMSGCDAMREGASMQFSLCYEAPEAPQYTHTERFAAMRDLIVYGESLGFDVAWLAEIHCGGAISLLSAPFMVVPAIATPPISGAPSECINHLQAARDEFRWCQIICWSDPGDRLPMEAGKHTMAQFADAVMSKV